MTKMPLALTLLLTGATATAQETRELDAHEHGVGLLNLAFDGDQVSISLEAPGMDIVGFEYEAETAEDLAKIDAVVAQLSDPLALFVMPTAAECVVTEANAGPVDEEQAHEAAEAHAEGTDGGEEAHEEAHTDSEAHVEGEEHEEGEHHTEFQAQYLLTCANPDAIDGIDFAYFETFPDAAELEVQMISGAGTQGFEVMRAAPRLDLAGLI